MGGVLLLISDRRESPLFAGHKINTLGIYLVFFGAVFALAFKIWRWRRCRRLTRKGLIRRRLAAVQERRCESQRDESPLAPGGCLATNALQDNEDLSGLISRALTRLVRATRDGALLTSRGSPCRSFFLPFQNRES